MKSIDELVEKIQKLVALGYLVPEDLKDMIDHGLPKEAAEKWRTKYSSQYKLTAELQLLQFKRRHEEDDELLNEEVLKELGDDENYHI